MRIRTIKPEFFRDGTVVELPYVARLVFIGLWCCADRAGRLEDRPRDLQLSLLPGDPDEDVDDILNVLHSSDLIERYVVDGHGYIAIKNFEKHQRITGTEALNPSKHPGPPENHSGNTSEAPTKHSRHTGRERKGREGKGKEKTLRHSSPSFDVFWTRYPTRNGKKVGRQQASKAWDAMKLDTMAEEIGIKLDAQIAHRDGCMKAGVFCAEFPDAERWIKKRRWEDEVGGVPKPKHRPQHQRETLHEANMRRLGLTEDDDGKH